MTTTTSSHTFMTVLGTFFVSIEYDDETGRWVGSVPSLPGCIGEGETLEEARDDLREGIDQVLEAHAERGTEPPYRRP